MARFGLIKVRERIFEIIESDRLRKEREDAFTNMVIYGTGTVEVRQSDVRVQIYHPKLP